MANVYNTNPTISHTLSEFVVRATNLYQLENYDGFIRLVLTGEYHDDSGRPKQVFMDPIQNEVTLAHPLSISRDYDSLLGFSDRFLVNTAISIGAVPHPSFALKSSIHMKHTIRRHNRDHKVEYHHIPNFEFGNFGARHHLHIFFPDLWSPERMKEPHPPHHLSRTERAFWYLNGLRPAITDLLGHAVASQWPPTYEAEEHRAHNHRGGYSWATKIIPKEVVGDLAQRIRHHLEEDAFQERERAAWAKNFFIMHTVRGVKDTTSHRVDEESAGYFFGDFLADSRLSDDVPGVGEWYVDVGVEISSDDGECLQWMTGSHATIAQQALHIDDDVAARITSVGSSKYSRDLASHLTQVSGFRIVPGRRAEGEWQTKYIQAYTTDKSVVYNPEGQHHAKFITHSDAMGPIQPSNTVGGLYSIYEAAKKVNSSNARLEVRVPSRFATQALIEFDPDVLRGCLCSFTRAEWWSFRLIRLLGFSQTLTLQAEGPSEKRFLYPTLTLTAACMWLVNSLHARPEDGPASRRLMDAVLPVTEREDADRDVLAYNTSTRPAGQHEDEEPDPDNNDSRSCIPYNPYGCIFLRRVVVTDVPRLRCEGPIIGGSTFSFWFENKDIDQLKAKYQRTGIVDRNAVMRSTTNKSRLLPPYSGPTDGEEPVLFDLGTQGHALAEPILDDASDVEDGIPMPPEYEGANDIDSILSTLWRQFVCDLTSKSPNQQGYANPSYLKIKDIDRRSASEEPYKSLNFPQIFTACYYKQAALSEWKTSFNWLLPPAGYKTTTAVQNYRQSPYFRQWLNILELNENNRELIDKVRDVFWKRISKWSWMPNAQSDRMWPTSAKKPSMKSFIRWPAADNKPPAPIILLKPNGVPIFTIPLNDTIADTNEGNEGQ